jgi:shikimate dehydrogenase
MTDGNAAPERRVLLGLIGAPISQSAAPAMHEAAAAALGLRCHYQLIEVAGADDTRLRIMLEGVRCLGFAGVNVTYPYKEAAVALLDEVAPDAAAIGSINTVAVRGGRLVGHNTDATGFARSYAEIFGSSAGRTVALIGAGGVGKAAGFALAGSGAALRIFDRDAGKADALARALAARTQARVCGSVADALAGADGLVNATPIGMLPNRDTPVPLHLLRRDLWVADVVYTPLWTPLLTAAREAGAKVMTGRELTIHQAADAFRLFTGVEPSRDVIGAAFDGAMERRYAPRSAG